MLRRITEILNSFDFEVQDTSYERQLEHDHLSPLRGVDLPNTDAANVLIAHPQIFVIHRHRKPAEGIFYIFISDHAIKKGDYLYELFANFYPPLILNVFPLGDNGDLYSKWVHENTKPILLTEFLSRI